MKATLLALALLLAGCERPRISKASATSRCAELLAAVFAELPAAVAVLPTEHYYYWQRTVDGVPLHGNLRFANGLREQGTLTFAYAGTDVAESAAFTAAEGVVLTCEDAFTVRMSLHGKTVTFHLHQLPQTPPPFALSAEEQFVERTCDDSSLQFYLIYQRTGNYFLWMLDPTTLPPLMELRPNVALDERTGFVFWHQGDRYVLAAVAAANIRANNAYDGPFDQLADNYALTSHRQALMEQAVPECAGRIDAYGNYRDTPRPRRVALVPYCPYATVAEATAFVTTAMSSKEPLRYLSRVGVP